MEVAECISKLEGKIELLELDNHFSNEQQQSSTMVVVDKIFSIAENYQVIQQLIEAKQQAIQSAREVNTQLREYIALLELSSGTLSLSVTSNESGEDVQLIASLSDPIDW